jgi:multisubunit Na+/H+ antiporter MnhB subunit
MNFNLNISDLMTSQGLAGALAIIIYIITNYFNASDIISKRALDLIKLSVALILSFVAFYVTGNLTTPDSYMLAFFHALESQFIATGVYENLKNIKEKR